MRGRKPTPARLRLLRGNPRQRPVRGDDLGGLPALGAAPDVLDAEARREWARIAAAYGAAGVLTALDRAALAAVCALWSQFVRAEQAIQAGDDDGGPGELMTTGAGAMQSAWVSIRNGALDRLRPYLAELGLTPTARMRLRATLPAEAPDGKSRFFRGA